MLRIRRQIRQVSSAEMRAALPEKICELINNSSKSLSKWTRHGSNEKIAHHNRPGG